MQKMYLAFWSRDLYDPSLKKKYYQSSGYESVHYKLLIWDIFHYKYWWYSEMNRKRHDFFSNTIFSTLYRTEVNVQVTINHKHDVRLLRTLLGKYLEYKTLRHICHTAINNSQKYNID